MKQGIAAYAPLVLWAAAVLIVGSLSIRTASLPTGSDKVAHFIMYGVGGLAAAWAGRQRGAGAGWLALLLVALVGALDELHQATLPTRQSDILDWAADVAGGTLFFLLARRLAGRK